MCMKERETNIRDNAYYFTDTEEVSRLNLR